MDNIAKDAERVIKLLYESLYSPFIYEGIQFYNVEKMKKVKPLALICIDEKIKMINGSLDSEELNYYIAVKDYITNNY